jgi:hypothetical protein
MIDWDDIKEGVNEKYDKRFHTTQNMLAEMYSDIGNLRKIAGILGVCETTVRHKFDELGIRRKMNPHPSRIRVRLAEMYPEIQAGMSTVEIAERLNCCKGAVWNCMRDIGKPMSRRKEWAK